MSLRNKLAIVGLSGVMFTGAAVGLSGIASAQGPELQAESGSAVAAQADTGEADAIELEAFEFSAEDEAVFEQYDQCLVDNGFDDSVFESDMEIDGDAAVAVEVFEIDESMEAAFEACDPILGDLSGDMVMMDDLGDIDCWVGDAELGDITEFELTPEQEAMLEEDGVVTFSATVGTDGDVEIIEGSELAEGDWAEVEEFFGDEDDMIEYFEVSPEDEILLDDLEGFEDFEGCDGAVAFSVDGGDFDELELEELLEGEVEAATSDA